MVKQKVIPVLIKECNSNVKFAHLVTVVDPPQILIAFLQHFDFILEKTDPSIHTTKVNQSAASEGVLQTAAECGSADVRNGSCSKSARSRNTLNMS
jgi:hypothetical protein